VASALAVFALLGFAVSLVGSLYQTSRHRSSRAWAFATGAFLVLVLLFGTVSNAVSRHSGLTLRVYPRTTSWTLNKDASLREWNC
jgi:hypothetical protein